MAAFSMAALSLATVRPVFMANLLQGPAHFDPRPCCFLNSRRVSLPAIDTMAQVTTSDC